MTASATCADAEDCESADENCRRQWHCVDAVCRCGLGSTINDVIDIIDEIGGIGK